MSLNSVLNMTHKPDHFRNAITNAFRKWSDVTPLTFRPGRGDVNIEIGFGRREHGDGYGNAFDGRGKQ